MYAYPEAVKKRGQLNKSLNMKKILFACGILATGFAFSNSASAQTGVLTGLTRQQTNGSGGTTTTCPPSSVVCTTNTKNPNGTHTITIFKYDSNGNQIGTETLITRSGADAYQQDIPNGYIHDVQTTDGVLWGKIEN